MIGSGLALAVLSAVLTVTSPAFAQADAEPARVLAPTAETPLGSGPYRAVMEQEDALPGFTFYRPADLSTFGPRSLPIAIWANGACANQGNAFRAFLSEIASYGYVVIALGPVDPAVPLFEPQNLPATSAAAPFTPPPNVTMPPPRTRSAQMIEAMDWATGRAPPRAVTPIKSTGRRSRSWACRAAAPS